ncbi:hypothetical protein Tco_0558498 [Tanacetum coccineum]
MIAVRFCLQYEARMDVLLYRRACEASLENMTLVSKQSALIRVTDFAPIRRYQFLAEDLFGSKIPAGGFQKNLNVFNTFDDGRINPEEINHLQISNTQSKCLFDKNATFKIRINKIDQYSKTNYVSKPSLDSRVYSRDNNRFQDSTIPLILTSSACSIQPEVRTMSINLREQPFMTIWRMSDWNIVCIGCPVLMGSDVVDNTIHLFTCPKVGPSTLSILVPTGDVSRSNSHYAKGDVSSLACVDSFSENISLFLCVLKIREEDVLSLIIGRYGNLERSLEPLEKPFVVIETMQSKSSITDEKITGTA